MTDIASVSFAKPLDEIADELGRSFAEFGFAVVRDHGIPQELIDRAETKSKEYFALPQDVKRKYVLEGSGGAARRWRQISPARKGLHSAMARPGQRPLVEFRAWGQNLGLAHKDVLAVDLADGRHAERDHLASPARGVAHEVAV